MMMMMMIMMMMMMMTFRGACHPSNYKEQGILIIDFIMIIFQG